MDTTNGGGLTTWSARDISLRAQKKFLSKVGGHSNARSFVLDEQAAKTLEQLLKVLKERIDKKEAEKMVKHVIKVAVKIGVLRRHDRLTEEDEKALDQFRNKFHNVIMAVISFCEVDYSYDRAFLRKALHDSQKPLKFVLERHLSGKSGTRISNVFTKLSKDEVMDSMFLLPKSDVKELTSLLRRAMDRELI